MTAYLVDTHTLIWWWLDRPLLSAAARQVLGDAGSELRVSVVTAFEIGQKHRIGKLPAMEQALAAYDETLGAEGISQVPVNGAHALLAGTLEGEHRDPFDRMIAAQALIEGLTVVSRDPAFAGFGCKVLW